MQVDATGVVSACTEGAAALLSFTLGELQARRLTLKALLPGLISEAASVPLLGFRGVAELAGSGSSGVGTLDVTAVPLAGDGYRMLIVELAAAPQPGATISEVPRLRAAQRGSHPDQHGDAVQVTSVDQVARRGRFKLTMRCAAPSKSTPVPGRSTSAASARSVLDDDDAFDESPQGAADGGAAGGDHSQVAANGARGDMRFLAGLDGDDDVNSGGDGGDDEHQDGDSVGNRSDSVLVKPGGLAATVIRDFANAPRTPLAQGAAAVRASPQRTRTQSAAVMGGSAAVRQAAFPDGSPPTVAHASAQLQRSQQLPGPPSEAALRSFDSLERADSGRSQRPRARVPDACEASAAAPAPMAQAPGLVRGPPPALAGLTALSLEPLVSRSSSHESGYDGTSDGGDAARSCRGVVTAGHSVVAAALAGPSRSGSDARSPGRRVAKVSAVGDAGNAATEEGVGAPLFEDEEGVVVARRDAAGDTDSRSRASDSKGSSSRASSTGLRGMQMMLKVSAMRWRGPWVRCRDSALLQIDP